MLRFLVVGVTLFGVGILLAAVATVAVDHPWAWVLFGMGFFATVSTLARVFRRTGHL